MGRRPFGLPTIIPDLKSREGRRKACPYKNTKSGRMIICPYNIPNLNPFLFPLYILNNEYVTPPSPTT